MHGAFCTSLGDHWCLGEVGRYFFGHTLRQEGPEGTTLCTSPPVLPLLGTRAQYEHTHTTHTVPCRTLDMPGISGLPISHRALDVLKDFAPGAQLPVLLYNSEPKTDTITIEEFLEDQLSPPMCPSLVPQYPESSLAGNDIFHKFSAFIKNPVPAQDEALQRSLLRALLKLDEYLSAPLEHELAQDPHLRVSQRHFLDGNHLTLADCNLLPKLNIVQVSYGHPSTVPFSFP
uniref:CLIC N-terminal domain-containing protein n=1 Tax=Geospiza parvula TaxID=87175 RepID=A0A8C3NL43_GEOPR